MIAPRPQSPSTRPARRSPPRVSPPLLAVAASLGLLTACQSGSSNPQNGSVKETGQQLFGKTGKSGERAAPTGPASNSWSIMIGAYSGPDQAREARNSLAVLQSLGFLDAFAEPRGKATIVALGRYPEPGDPRAQEDLARIRDFVVNGERPYTRAMLVPPETAAAGPMSELDLRSARDKYGRGAVFTLQIGVYARPDQAQPTPDDLAKFRAAAEQAAAKLRREGDEAFFYHGPFRSMVTVGVFDYADSDRGSGKPESDRLTQTRKRHPHNLLNGVPYRAKRSGPTPPGGAKPDDYVKSDLVEIPAN